MSTTLWIGIVTIVCILEVVRIGMTTYVLVHLLESRSLRRDGEETGLARRSLQSVPARARREVLLDPTLTALRSSSNTNANGGIRNVPLPDPTLDRSSASSDDATK